MFPPNETPAEDADIVAGEYVLGSLEAGDAAAIRLRADTDPALLFAIGSWQARLVPLTAMLMPVAPPNSLWVRLANEVGFLEAEAPVSMTPLPMPGLSEPSAKEVVASTDCIGPNGTVSDVTESSVAQTDRKSVV